MEALTEAEVADLATRLPDWTVTDTTIGRDFTHANFVDAIGFVTRVAMIAEKQFHHPDIDIRWNTVTLTLQTHDTGGLTHKDAELARAIDDLA